jgi:ATP-binding cassette subfamily C protein
MFDLPWMPFYVAICYLFHPWLGALVLGGCLCLAVVTAATEIATRRPMRLSSLAGAQRATFVEASRRNAEVVHSMGMASHLSDRWAGHNGMFQAAQRRAADITNGFGGLSKVLRMMLQSAVLALGAFLVIRQEASAGIIIASSILTSRALAPVELAVAHWKGFVSARQSWARLKELLAKLPADGIRIDLPKPAESLSVEAVSVAPPGAGNLVVRDVSFTLEASQGVGIIGPSGSGKSSLARAIVGVWPSSRGKIRLDGASLDQWSAEALGPHIGYLPQDMELFHGTVGENIARFDPKATSETVVAAARAAGAHSLILGFPQGYETEIGDGGAKLSVGQRQRVGLARALYGNPFLVVLDEPNSNLDSEGEEALTQAILGVRKRQGVIVVIAHRPSALAGVDKVLVMQDGRLHSFGAKETVLKAVIQSRPEPRPLRVASRLQESTS